MESTLATRAVGVKQVAATDTLSHSLNMGTSRLIISWQVKTAWLTEMGLDPIVKM
jgi:hypothetical protein